MAYIYLKKDDKPVHLPDDKLEAVSGAFENYVTKKQDTLLRLPSQDIRASEIRKIVHANEQTKSDELSREELNLFKQELKPYLNEKGHLTMEREFDYLKDRGVITLTKKRPVGECKTMSDFEIAVLYSKINEYSEETRKLSAWRDWMGKVDYAKRAEAEQLAKMTGVLSDKFNANGGTGQSTQAQLPTTGEGETTQGSPEEPRVATEDGNNQQNNGEAVPTETEEHGTTETN